LLFLIKIDVITLAAKEKYYIEEAVQPIIFLRLSKTSIAIVDQNNLKNFDFEFRKFVLKN